MANASHYWNLDRRELPFLGERLGSAGESFHGSTTRRRELALLLSSARDRERELDPELCTGRSLQVQPATQLPGQDTHECHAHALALAVIEVGRQALSIVPNAKLCPALVRVAEFHSHVSPAPVRKRVLETVRHQLI